MIYRPRSESKEMDTHFCILVGLGLLCIASRIEAYQNITVGGTAGWFFDTLKNSSIIDYTNWASTQNASLGDYLIFNTNTNHSVIQTYNKTTFETCDYDDSQDDDTFVWLLATEPTITVRVSIPLTIEGMNYFLSSALDGIECVKGMSFGMNVSHGEGLPQSLRHPPPPPFAEPPDSTGNDNSSSNDIPAVTIPPPGSGSLRISSLEALVISLVVLSSSLVVHLC